MKTVYEREVNMPAYALPYLINADDSGLSDEDKATIDRWYKRIERKAEADKGDIIISPNWDDNGEDTFFTWLPEFGLACDCILCDVIILTE